MTNLERLCLLFYQLNIGTNKKLFDYFDQCQNVDYTLIEQIFDKEAVHKVKYALENGIDVKMQDELYQNNVEFVTFYSKNYPELLKEIDGKPFLLYYIGNASLFNSPCLAIIGSRKASSYGRRVTQGFARRLAEKYTIVSGLAYGIDAIAHTSTLEVDGKTIAVLGSGLLNVYPSTHRQLAQDIVEKGGLIVSEYGLYAKPNAYHFPQRNRIVSGLCQGVLVTQAGKKSGTFSTVDCALEQGRDLYVVPGEIFDLNHDGCNHLIKRMQGSVVTSPDDIFNLTETAPKKQSAVQLNMEEEQIVNLLKDGKVHFDFLVAQTGLPLTELNYLLANLQLKGIIEKLTANYYKLVGDFI